MLGTIVIIILILFLVGALPTWPHSRSWGYAPTGILGTILIIVLILYPPGAALGGVRESTRRCMGPGMNVAGKDKLYAYFQESRRAVSEMR